MFNKRTLCAIVFILSAGSLLGQYHEDDYARMIQREIGGELETAVQSGFVDLLTDQYAIEIEFAAKWKQAIGQALWYGLQTNHVPGIVLIRKSNSEYKYVQMLGSALDYGGLREKIKVWVWPDDFEASAQERYRRSAHPAIEKYWLTTASDTRHNAGCRYFEDTAGRFCEKREGTACGFCGG